MAKKGGRPGQKGTISIRREEVVEAGRHSGAWKVAYADFVTAMMAFFLLMWLLNMTTEEQRKGLADYFSPNSLLSHANSGNGQPFGGHTPFDAGALASDRGALELQPGPKPPQEVEDDEESDPASPSRSASQATPAPAVKSEAKPGLANTPSHPADGDQSASQAREPAVVTPASAPSTPDAKQEHEVRDQEANERKRLESAAAQLRDAVRNDPALADSAQQLAIDITPQGLRVQILDQERRPMFAFGSSTPNDRARLLLQKTSSVLMKLPERISITGHTDSAPFHSSDRTNWELSADRANAARRLLVEAGLPLSRIQSVVGQADRDPLVANNPMAAENRRIAIMVLRDKPEGQKAPAAEH
ncbi:MAG: OmpA family protein [Acetobacteraceae bacterium]|nr:OmpA family protein [Acetobacteraceae bacterium]